MKRRPLIALVSGIVVVLLVATWLRSNDDGPVQPQELSLNAYLDLVERGEVESAEIFTISNRVEGTLADGQTYEVDFLREFGDELVGALDASPEPIALSFDNEPRPLWQGLLSTFLPILVLVGLFFVAINYLGKGRTGQFGKAKAKSMSKHDPKVTFADVAGADEAVEELHEIKEFLQSPLKFQSLGASIPKGVLLFGPPGTGKTLLARAVAGEAGVPFFSISGSDFVEMFVGVGASRVRDLFQQAKDAAPAIIFVDEIDAVGRHRGAGLGGGHDEREQTLNQLLVEMDGFDVTSGVILIAATNRPDILDPALLRPGRFDRQITVDRPDRNGRKVILGVHSQGKPTADDVDLETVARRTPGFTGADLANLMNEAALLTARRNLPAITNDTIEDAIDRVLAGPERKGRVMSDHEKRVIAYHEAGHALVGHVLQNTDPIHKVSIIARGRALGWTLSLPEEDKYLQTRSQLRDQLAMLLGGRTAEEMIFGDPTTGAADDIDRTSKLARAMVTEYGMSEELGPQRFGAQREEVFLGKDMAHEANYSDDVAKRIDEEVGRLVEIAHLEAGAILEAHRATLDTLAESLIEHETLDQAKLGEIFADLETWTGRDAIEIELRSQFPSTSHDPARVGEYRAEPPESGSAPA